MRTFRQICKAILIVWLVFGGTCCLILAAPFIVQEDVLYSMVPECSRQARYGLRCPLCGMTRSFVLVSSGRFAEARDLNPYALYVYAAFLWNGVSAVAFVLVEATFKEGRGLTGIVRQK